MKIDNVAARFHISERLSDFLKTEVEIPAGTWKTWQRKGHPAARWLDQFTTGTGRGGQATRFYDTDLLDQFTDEFLLRWLVITPKGRLELSRRLRRKRYILTGIGRQLIDQEG